MPTVAQTLLPSMPLPRAARSHSLRARRPPLAVLQLRACARQAMADEAAEKARAATLQRRGF
eukprot:4782374-Lingulodinium_polyedra.AAC.1